MASFTGTQRRPPPRGQPQPYSKLRVLRRLYRLNRLYPPSDRTYAFEQQSFDFFTFPPSLKLAANRLMPVFRSCAFSSSRVLHGGVDIAVELIPLFHAKRACYACAPFCARGTSHPSSRHNKYSGSHSLSPSPTPYFFSTRFIPHFGHFPGLLLWYSPMGQT